MFTILVIIASVVNLVSTVLNVRKEREAFNDHKYSLATYYCVRTIFNLIFQIWLMSILK